MEHLQQFEVALKTARTQLVTELENLAVYNKETDDWEIKTDAAASEESDESLVADAAEQADMDISMLAELENQYHHIQIALSKIKQGIYGSCEIGGELIENDRLHANPAARTCKIHMNDESTLPL